MCDDSRAFAARNASDESFSSCTFIEHDMRPITAPLASSQGVRETVNQIPSLRATFESRS